MTLEALLTIVAILLGPIIALAIQRSRDKRREERQKKFWVFRELMVTRHRGSRLAPRHIEALNSIDVEFYGKTTVLDAWKAYLDLFTNASPNATEAEQLLWLKNGDDLLAKLLYAMAQELGYHFDETLLKRNAYLPIAHTEADAEANVIRKGFFEVFTGKRKFPMEVDFAQEFKDFLTAQQQPQTAPAQPQLPQQKPQAQIPPKNSSDHS